MSDNDWGRGDWWEIWPPPPGETPDDDGTFQTDKAVEGEDFPMPPEPVDVPEPGSWEIELGLSEQIVDVYDFMLRPENINPSELRGIGFFDPGEALNWLEQIGLLSISGLVQIDGLFFPVIGTSDGLEDVPEGSDQEIPF